MHLVALVFILNFLTVFAQAGILTFSPKRAGSSQGTHSRIKRICLLSAEDVPDLEHYCQSPDSHVVDQPIVHLPIEVLPFEGLPVVDPPVEDPSVHSYTINDTEISGSPIPIEITVPGTLSVDTWNDILLANLKTTLPNTLGQFNVDASQISALTAEGLPLLVEAISALQSGSSLPDTEFVLARRGLFCKIGRCLKEVT